MEFGWIYLFGWHGQSTTQSWSLTPHSEPGKLQNWKKDGDERLLLTNIFPHSSKLKTLIDSKSKKNMSIFRNHLIWIKWWFGNEILHDIRDPPGDLCALWLINVRLSSVFGKSKTMRTFPVGLALSMIGQGPRRIISHSSDAEGPPAPASPPTPWAVSSKLGLTLSQRHRIEDRNSVGCGNNLIKCSITMMGLTKYLNNKKNSYWKGLNVKNIECLHRKFVLICVQQPTDLARAPLRNGHSQQETFV